MPSDTETRASISEALNSFATAPILDASRRVFETLGYKSERRPSFPDSKPTTFLENFDGQRSFNTERGMLGAWKSADFLCQVTDEEIQLARKNQPSLLADGKIEKGNARSFAFLSIGLNEGTYTRAQYSGITREINRMFNMPAICLFKNNGAVTLSVIDRRQHKKESAKDVLEKVTLIKDIEYKNPHRGHVDILSDLALPNLAEKFPPLENFDHLLRAWRETLDISTLNKRFYRELSNWYFWALPQVRFPTDLESNDEKLRATSLIRLLTRLIFCWFLKEKNLIPDKLFRVNDLANILKGFDPESEASSTYYLAILQNLFFATLNQRMGKDSNGNPYRAFAKDEGFQKNRSNYDVNNLYRYESLFIDDPEASLAQFADIPFLNGGLFECLDRTEDGTDKKLYLDGFSRNPKKRPHVPDRLFFDSGEVADLSDVYDDKKRKAERVTGLINILDRYKFTIVENTPIDEEVALDPELLGKVFENLLASYNEETKTTARKQTGSFYTPRPIVDYMVDESLKAHLTRALVEKARMKEPDARAGLDLLLAYTEKEHPFTAPEVATLIAAIDEVKILDPACGSGAFPMGVLHKLVYILGKLDPDNDRWKQTQLAKLDSAPMREALEAAFADNNDDYGRKLYLIENCLYGVDIQPIAIQITKLRFFISLVCDQKTNRNKKENHGIRPLPNLETKFVAADTLIGLPISDKDLFIESLIAPIEKEIEDAYHGHFTIQRRDQKLALQKKIKALRHKLAETLAGSLGAVNSAKAKHLAAWDPFDPQSTADFFDPHWMFGQALKNGFDIVIGNPPYLRIQGIQQTNPKAAEYYKQHYESATGSFDLYVIFMERGMQLIGKSGILNFINPDKWVNASFGKGIRRFAIAQQNVHKLISFGAHQIFSACTYSSLLWMGRSPTAAIRYARVAPDESKAASIDDELIKLEASAFAAIPFDSLSDEPWILPSIESAHAMGQILAIQRRTSDLFRIFVGLQTSKDSVYFLKQAVDKGETFTAYSPELEEQVEIEKGIVRHLLLGDQVHRYEAIRSDNLVLFPYDATGDGFPRLISASKIERQYPKGWHYLKRCEAILRGREHGRFDNDEWYQFGRKQGINEGGTPKLLAPDISLGGNFSIDRTGRFYTTTTLYGYIKHERVWESYEFLLAVMNSKVLWFYLKTSGSVLANGYFRYKPAYLQNFPIPDVSKKAEATISTLARCMLAAKAEGSSSAPAAFLEDLIDACVMECYFREHMAERDLLFHDLVAPHLAAYAPEASAAQQRDYLTHLHQTLNAPSHPIRNRLDRITTDSPELVAVIKRDGNIGKSASVGPNDGEQGIGDRSDAKAAPNLNNASKAIATLSNSKASESDQAEQNPRPMKTRVKSAQDEDKPVRIDETEQNDVLCTIRQMFSEGLELSRELAFKKIAKELGYDRVGSKIEESLDSNIRTAVKRGILENERGTLKILCKTIEGYEREFLKDQFLASIGRPWVEREEAIRAFTRFMGFRRAGEKIQDTIRSLINGLLREDRLESDGHLIRRKS